MIGLYGERIPDPDVSPLQTVVRDLLKVVLLLTCFLIVYEAGRADTAELASQAFAREEQRTLLLELTISQLEGTLVYVRRVDAELHDQITTMYPTHPYVQAWEVDR